MTLNDEQRQWIRNRVDMIGIPDQYKQRVINSMEAAYVQGTADGYALYKVCKRDEISRSGNRAHSYK